MTETDDKRTPARRATDDRFADVVMSVHDRYPDRTAFVAADKGHVAVVSAQGEIEWETPARADVHDLWLLPDGNVLFLYGPAKIVEIGSGLLGM